MVQGLLQLDEYYFRDGFLQAGYFDSLVEMITDE